MKQKCPVCDTEKFEVLEIIDIVEQHAAYVSMNEQAADDLTRALQGITGTYRMLKCYQCGLEYADPFVSPGSQWYQILYSNLNLFPEIRWEFREVRESIGRGESVFDYGCGGGAFLRSVQNITGETHGGDFSPAAVAEARKCGLKADVIYEGTGPRSIGITGTFDHVVAFHVLEHLDRPDALFEFAQAIANHKTRLWIAVPSDKRAVRFLGGEDHLDQPPHHLSRWTVKSLELIGIKKGWKIRTQAYEPTGFRARAWELSRRTNLYRRMVAFNPHLERIARLLLLPFLDWKRGRELSGFSMLVSYDRLHTL